MTDIENTGTSGEMPSDEEIRERAFGHSTFEGSSVEHYEATEQAFTNDVTRIAETDSTEHLECDEAAVLQAWANSRSIGLSSDPSYIVSDDGSRGTVSTEDHEANMERRQNMLDVVNEAGELLSERVEACYTDTDHSEAVQPGASPTERSGQSIEGRG